MKKGYILTLALLASLPGCYKKKQNQQKPTKERMEQSIDVASSVDIPLADDNNDDSDDENNTIVSFFDEDLEEFSSFDDEFSMTTAYAGNANQSDSELFSWVDAQIEDEFQTVYFDFNRYDLRVDQKVALTHNIEQLKQLLEETDVNTTIVVDGHTCQEGTPLWNIPLSERRAKAVADYFVEAGIPQEKIKIVGRGQEVPAVIDGKAVDGSRQERWPNRRAEVRVIYT